MGQNLRILNDNLRYSLFPEKRSVGEVRRRRRPKAGAARSVRTDSIRPARKEGESKPRVQGDRIPLVRGPGAEGPRQAFPYSGLGRFWVVSTAIRPGVSGSFVGFLNQRFLL